MATSIYLIAGSPYTFHLTPASSVGSSFTMPVNDVTFETNTSAPADAQFIGDYNSDGRLDIIAYDSASAHFMSGNGDGTFGTAQTGSVATAKAAYNAELVNQVIIGNIIQDWQFFGGNGWTGNVDTDFTNEPFVLDKVNNIFSIAYRFLSSPVSYSIGHPLSDSATADVNNDGFTDIVLVNADNTVSVLLHDNPVATPVVTNINTATPITMVGYGTNATLTHFQISALPANGTLYADAGLTQVISAGGTVAASGTAATVYFKPTTGWSGSTSLSYLAMDATTGNTSATAATQQITVTLVNDVVPALTGAAATLAAGTEEASITLTSAQLLQGWTDPDAGQTLSVINVTSNHGSVVNNGNGTWTYTPTANYSGAVTFSYGVSDGILTSGATLSTTLTAVNDIPALTGAAATLTAGAEDSAYTVTAAQLLTGWTDVDGNTLGIAGNSVSADHGTVTFDAATSTYTVTPTANYNGTVTLSYSVTDGTAPVATTKSITLAAVNDTPALTSAAATLTAGTEDTPYTVSAAQLLSGWSDVDGNTLSVAGNTITADHGTVSYNAATSTYTVTPEANYNGTVTLSYSVTDGVAPVAAAQSFTLAPVNDAPALTGTAASLGASTEDTLYTVSAAQLLTGWTDADGNTLSVAGNTVTADHGTVTFDSATSTYTVTPEANYNGTVTLSYSVTDGVAPVAATQSFTLAPVNDAPALTGTAASLGASNEDTLYTVSAAQLLTGWTDADGNTLSVAGNTVTADHGTVTFDSATSTYTVTPEANYNGTVTLSYSVTDGVAPVTATQSFTLAPVNDAPALTGTAASLAASTEDTSYTVSAAQLLTGWTDVESDALSIAANTVTADHGTVSYNAATSTYTVTPEANYNGTVTLSYSVTDSSTATVATTQGFSLAAVNDAPALTGTAATLSDAAQDTPYTVSARTLLQGYTDVDGDSLSILNLTADHGTLTDNLDGTFTLSPEIGFDGSILFGYVITDGNGGSATTSLNLGVTASQTVTSPQDYTLPASKLDLVLTGSIGHTGTGNTLDNHLTGSSGADILYGLDGNDTINGGAGNDTIDGSTGNDLMYGGTGDDTYYVDAQGDSLVEVAAEGTDTVYSNGRYTLNANLENLVLLAGTTNGGGNDLDNLITGNGANNLLAGHGGNDTIDGGAGNDTIYSGTGDDVMYGGTGDDTYYVDVQGDRIVEIAAEGTDTVYSNGRYTLNANLENLVLLAGTTNGGGNSLDNVLTGNSLDNLLAGGAGNDTLDGGTGADTLYGGTGNDTYFVDSSGDRIVENASEGIDTVVSSVNKYTLGTNLENLTLAVSTTNGAGNALDNILRGNANNNVLDGKHGNDTLIGGLGNDVLAGGAGADQFVFDTAPAQANADLILDFTSGTDKIVFDSAVYTALGTPGQALDASILHAGAGFTTAAAATDHLIFNTSTGALYYDADGAGGQAATLIASLSGVHAVSASDFFVA